MCLPWRALLSAALVWRKRVCCGLVVSPRLTVRALSTVEDCTREDVYVMLIV